MRATEKIRILLAEDSEDDVFVFRYAMRKAGVDVELTVLKSGQKVMDYISGKRVYADRAVFPIPSLIFLDGQLHREPSTALLKWLRSNPSTQNTPLIVLTGNQDPQIREEAKACGAMECIAKPMTQEHWATLRNLLLPR
jgi:CheY-like chemotaxis protein